MKPAGSARRAWHGGGEPGQAQEEGLLQRGVLEALEPAGVALVSRAHVDGEKQRLRVGLAGPKAGHILAGSKYWTWPSHRPLVTSMAG